MVCECYCKITDTWKIIAR
ncbi:hypothetical protein Ahy_B03g064682 isoform D [Arachis hypogaea]|uniref:Uncharacterized protein n=1 Tax=Arachis hypogaea TaxID=3818 RepID=A0A445A068_ARAHY|nr:hypothetical protein Ahy_B03g064682 isoform D [Arachis hypogaea]